MVTLYVAYTGNPPALPPDCGLIPFESPRQDLSELWLHKKIWQEHSAEAVGIFHLRRYLDLDKPVLPVPSAGKPPLPYRIRKEPDTSAYTREKLDILMHHFDVIAPTAERTGIPVYQRFGQSDFQRSKDLALACRILLTHHPELAEAAFQYLSGNVEYYGNLFLMRWNIFDQYCQLLFDVLDQFEARAVSPPPRTAGYLGERIFGIYFTWLQAQPGVRCGEVPRVHFWTYDDDIHHLRRNIPINWLLPPGSARRCWLRRHLS